MAPPPEPVSEEIPLKTNPKSALVFPAFLEQEERTRQINNNVDTSFKI
jgi:hypothetical protein